MKSAAGYGFEWTVGSRSCASCCHLLLQLFLIWSNVCLQLSACPSARVHPHPMPHPCVLQVGWSCFVHNLGDSRTSIPDTDQWPYRQEVLHVNVTPPADPTQDGIEGHPHPDAVDGYYHPGLVLYWSEEQQGVDEYQSMFGRQYFKMHVYRQSESFAPINQDPASKLDPSSPPTRHPVTVYFDYLNRTGDNADAFLLKVSRVKFNMEESGVQGWRSHVIVDVPSNGLSIDHGGTSYEWGTVMTIYNNSCPKPHIVLKFTTQEKYVDKHYVFLKHGNEILASKESINGDRVVFDNLTCEAHNIL